MLKKRLIGVITVKDGLGVQSFGYKKYFPLGKAEILAKNFNRWGADEIFLNVIDRSDKIPLFNNCRNNDLMALNFFEKVNIFLI